jgi:exosortase
VVSTRRAIFPLLIIAIALMAAYWFVLASLFAQWADDPNYAHGFFVAPMAAYLAWRRRKQWHATPPDAAGAGLVLLAIAALVYLAGVLAAELFTMRVSFVFMVTAVICATQGRERLRVMRYPLFFLLAMVPLPYVLYYRLTFPLQLESSRLAAGILGGLGMPLLREGNVIHLEGYSLDVVAACSGLRSIMTLGTLALFFNDLLRMAAGWRLAYLGMVIPIAIAANVARLVITAGIAAIQGADAAESFLHELSGVGVFVFGLLAIVACGKGFEWIARTRTS